MTKLKLFKYSSGLLLFLNIAMIVFFIITKPAGHRKVPGKQFQDRAVELLKMDEVQKAKFKKLASEHNEEIVSQAKEHSELLKKYFQTLISNEHDHAAILERLKVLNLDKIETTYSHFKSIKALLNVDQDKEYELFINEAIGRILAKPR